MPRSTLSTSPCLNTAKNRQLRYRVTVNTQGFTSSVSRVWAVMSGTVINIQTSRKSNPGLQAALFNKRPRAGLDFFSDIQQFHTRSYELPRMPADLSVHFGGAPNVVICHLRVLYRHPFVVTLLLGRGAPCVAKLYIEHTTRTDTSGSGI